MLSYFFTSNNQNTTWVIYDSAYMPNFSVSVESDSKNKTTIVWTKCFVQPAIIKFPSKHPDLQLRELQRVYLKTVKQI